MNGRRISLQVRGKKNSATAYSAWHRLITEAAQHVTSEPQPAEVIPPTPTPPVQLLGEVVPAFLAEARPRTKPSTHATYTRHLTKLTARYGKKPLAHLTVPLLVVWLQGLKVNSTTQAITLQSVSAFFGWCVRQSLLPKNPVLSMAKPKTRSRGEEAVIAPEDHGRLLAGATPQFRLVLQVLHATGARPSEVCNITAENFDPVACVVKLTEHKSDRSGRVRLLFLTPEVVTLLKLQAEKHHTGPLLRHRQGRGWTAKAISNAMNRLRQKTRVKAIAYGYRHTFATDALANGLPEAHVAGLLGHSSTVMLHKHYSHLTSKADVLRTAATRVRPPAPE